MAASLCSGFFGQKYHTVSHAAIQGVRVMLSWEYLMRRASLGLAINSSVPSWSAIFGSM